MLEKFRSKSMATFFSRAKFVLPLISLLGMIVSPAFYQATAEAPKNTRALESNLVRGIPNGGQLPLVFVPNEGQFKEGVKYEADLANSSLILRQTSFDLYFQTSRPESHGVSNKRTSPQTKRIEFDMPGANPTATIVASDTKGRINYAVGDNPAAWKQGVPAYAMVQYTGLYDNVDLNFYGKDNSYEHDFILYPGADTKSIGYRIKGADSIDINEAGDLEVSIGLDKVSLKRPQAYQFVGKERKSVPVEFALDNAHVGFRVGDYDHSRTLFIDPTLEYMVTTGQPFFHAAEGVAKDANGAIYTFGDFSGPAGDEDLYVIQWFESGVGTPGFVVSELGGTGDDFAGDIAVNANGDIYLAGWTKSTDLPQTIHSAYPKNQGGQDAYVIKLSLAGGNVSYQYVTYLGGSDADEAHDIKIDNTGNVYLTGNTQSLDFPTTIPGPSSFTDGCFVTKLNPNDDTRPLPYSQIFQGFHCYELSLDSRNDIYVAGDAVSNAVDPIAPVRPRGEGRDAFVMKVGPTRGVDLLSYVGGKYSEAADGLAVDSQGNMYIAGGTFSPDFPILNALQGTMAGPDREWGKYNAFITKLSPDGSSILYSTYLGGCASQIQELAIAPDDSLYAAGVTCAFANEMPWTSLRPLQQFQGVSSIDPRFFINGDAFFVKLNPTGSQVRFWTYLGSSGVDQSRGIIVDGSSVYVSGFINSNNNEFLAKLTSAQKIEIKEIELNQGVKAPDINGDSLPDLVLGRATLVRVHVQAPGDSDHPENNLVANLSFPNALDRFDGAPVEIPGCHTSSRSLKDLQAKSYIDFYCTPTKAGQVKVKVTIDPTSAGLEGSTLTDEKTVAVKKVRDIQYDYYRFAPSLLGEVSDEDFLYTFSNGNTYLRAVFPLPDNFKAVQHIGLAEDIPPSIVPSPIGIWSDAINIWYRCKLGTKAERCVGITPKNYFNYHLPGAIGVVVGLKVGAIPVALVQEKAPTVVAHELGHTYGFGENYDFFKCPDTACTPYNGQPQSYEIRESCPLIARIQKGITGKCAFFLGDRAEDGFWVQNREEDLKEQIGKFNYMGGGPPLFPDVTEWTTVQNFSTLFREFRAEKNDPELLLVTGSIDKSGNATFGPMYVTEGTVDQPTKGDTSVQLRDSNGNTLWSSAFAPTFTIPEFGADIDKAPFAFAMPYEPTATEIQIVQGGRVLTKAIISNNLLKDVIQAIPDVGYIGDPASSRSTLFAEVDTYTQEFTANNRSRAHDALITLRSDIDVKVRDVFGTASPLEMTKKQVLNLIDNLLGRLEILPQQLPGAPTIISGPSSLTNNQTAQFKWLPGAILNPPQDDDPYDFTTGIRAMPPNDNANPDKQTNYEIPNGESRQHRMIAEGKNVWIAYAASSSVRVTDGSGSHLAFLYNLYLAHSSDGGQTFPETTLINPIDTNESDSFRSPGLARRGNTIYTAWPVFDSSNGLGPVDNIYFAKKDDSGSSFSNPVLIASNVAGDPEVREPIVGVDANGVIYVVYEIGPTNFDSGSAAVLRSTDGGLTFIKVKDLGVGQEPSLLILPNNHVVIATSRGVWNSQNGTDWNFVPKSGFLRYFTTQLAQDQAGTIYLAKTVNPGICCRLEISTSSDEGVTFSAPITVSNKQTGTNDIGVVAGSAGHVFLYWGETTNGFPSGAKFGYSIDNGQSFHIQDLSAGGVQDELAMADIAKGNVYHLVPSSEGMVSIGSITTPKVKDFSWELRAGSTTSGSVVTSGNTTATTTTINALPDETYNFRILQTDTKGLVGPWSLPWVFKIDTTVFTPGAPQNIVASGGNASIDLKWQPPSNPGSFTVDGYQITVVGGNTTQTIVITDPSSLCNNVSSDATCEMSIGGLQNGFFYNISIRAHNTAGYGTSGTGSAVTVAPPNAPQIINASGFPGGASISWHSGGGIVDNFVVWYKTDTAAKEVQTSGSTTVAQISGLLPGHTYTFQVFAQNKGGRSDPSQSLSVTLPTVPGSPTDLKVSVDKGTIHVQWKAPTDTGGMFLQDFLVVAQDPLDFTGASHSQTVSFTGDTDYSTDFTDLDDRRSYILSVSAHNSIGYSDAVQSQYIPVKPIPTKDDTPPVITGVTTPAVNQGGWNSTDVSLTWNVSDPESNIATTTGCEAVTLTESGSRTCNATNGVGLSASSTVSVQIDKTAPEISYTTDQQANANGWFKQDVKVSWTTNDTESGIAASTGCNDVMVSQEGATTLTCKATNQGGLESTKTIKIKLDKSPPSLSCTVTPNSLWPPNHKLSLVKATVSILDGISGVSFILKSVTSNEPDDGLGDGDTPNDIQGFDLNAPDLEGQLRAERSGTGNGRVYTLTYEAKDQAGNTGSCIATVSVPKSR